MLPRQTKRTDVRAGACEVAAIGLWVRMLIELRPSAPVEAAKLPLTLTLGKKAGYFFTIRWCARFTSLLSALPYIEMPEWKSLISTS